jgi:hypothetical protein
VNVNDSDLQKRATGTRSKEIINDTPHPRATRRSKAPEDWRTP